MKPNQVDELFKALVSAYVWVASSDAGVDVLEFHKFEKMFVESPLASQVDESRIRPYFKDMVAAFEADYDAAVRLTRERLLAIKGNSFWSEEVVRLCRGAIVGDSKISESEEAVIKELGSILGLKEDL